MGQRTVIFNISVCVENYMEPYAYIYALFEEGRAYLLCCCLSVCRSVGQSANSFRSFSSLRLHILKWKLSCTYLGQVLFSIRSRNLWQSYTSWTLDNSNYLHSTQRCNIAHPEMYVQGRGHKCFSNISCFALIRPIMCPIEENILHYCYIFNISMYDGENPLKCTPTHPLPQK